MNDEHVPRASTDKDEMQKALDRYWISNMRIVAVLIPVWAGVSLGCGVVFADYLNRFHLPGTGYPLGFWFAQQGSIITFVLLILVYCIWMNRLDARHRRDMKKLQGGGARQ